MTDPQQLVLRFERGQSSSPVDNQIHNAQNVIVANENTFSSTGSTGDNIIVYTDVDQIPSDQVVYTTSEASANHSPHIVTMEGEGVGSQGTTSPVMLPGQQIQTLEMEVSQQHQDNQACLVCGDRGSGYHYSVYSCEGCKGFFKRTVQKNLSYNCKEDGNCNINKFTRNNCQYCRFQRCQSVGMKREAVREDRTPGGKHRHKRMKPDDTSTQTVTLLDAEELDADDKDSLHKLIEAKPTLCPNNEGMAPPEGDNSKVSINHLMQYGYMELRLIIEWARKVPGFSELLIEDQMALLKASFMELNVLRLAFRSLELDGRVNFVEGCELTLEQGAHTGWGKDLINCTLDFINCLKGISMDNTEFAILNAIVLTYPDAAGIQDKKAVADLQKKFLHIMRKYSGTSYSTEQQRYGRILLKLPALRTISAKAAERFLKMSLDGSIKMNALVWEMMS